jgi:hypothetical protein
MIYLASPYSHPDAFVREHRYLHTMQALGHLLTKRQWVFAPIVHCHELKKILELPGDHTFWLDYDCHILKLCEKLVVLRLEGWEESKGVRMEIEFAQANGIPVEYL